MTPPSLTPTWEPPGCPPGFAAFLVRPDMLVQYSTRLSLKKLQEEKLAGQLSDLKAELELERKKLDAERNTLITTGITLGRMALCFSSIFQLARELGFTTVRDVGGCFDFIRRRVADETELDVLEVYEEVTQLFEQFAGENGSATPAPLPDKLPSTEALRDVLSSVLSTTDFSKLKENAKSIGAEFESEELSKLRDSLRAFLRKTDPLLKSRMQGLAAAYESGKASLKDLEHALEINRADLLEVMDSLGVARRPPELSAAERAGLLERIRKNHENRPTPRPVDEGLVERDVRANLRLERMSSKPWNPPPTPKKE